MQALDRRPAEIYVFYEETYGKWECVVRFGVPHRDGYAGFHGESHYNFWHLIRELEWLWGRPLRGLKIKPKVRWYTDEGETENETSTAP